MLYNNKQVLIISYSVLLRTKKKTFYFTDKIKNNLIIIFFSISVLYFVCKNARDVFYILKPLRFAVARVFVNSLFGPRAVLHSSPLPSNDIKTLASVANVLSIGF